MEALVVIVEEITFLPFKSRRDEKKICHFMAVGKKTHFETTNRIK